MSLLALQLPPRRRLGPRVGSEDATAPAPPAEFDYVFSADGTNVSQTGRSLPARLPRADRTVLVLADADVSWHRVPVPKAPPARLRAAIAGAMEEALLDEPEAAHFALGPGAVPGSTGWVAVMNRSWFAGALAALAAAGREIAQVVPLSRPCSPSEGVRGHFSSVDPGSAPTLVLQRVDGVVIVNLDGALARSLLPGPEAPARWTASPAAAAAAEQFLGGPVQVRNQSERTLAAAGLPIDLRQFDLAPRHRGLQALRAFGRALRGPDWRPVRVGVAGLIVLQLVGLNAYAWQQERTLEAKRRAMDALLRSTFPGVRSVLDAPLQMQREADRARAAAGRPGEADLESLLAAASTAWPEGAEPTGTLRFEGGRLTLAAAGWGQPQVSQFGERLRGAGYTAEFADGRVSVAPLGRR